MVEQGVTFQLKKSVGGPSTYGACRLGPLRDLAAEDGGNGR
jgi:hypothetical protein